MFEGVGVCIGSSHIIITYAWRWRGLSDLGDFPRGCIWQGRGSLSKNFNYDVHINLFI